ncbi:MAG: hypothetical protein R3D25_07440 [Geminicoccaceae bacterium]
MSSCAASASPTRRAATRRSDCALTGIRLPDACHVTFDDGRSAAAFAFAGHRRHLVCHPRRSPGRTLLNARQSLRILRSERPALVVSTGADVAVPLLLLARCLFG